MKTTFVYLDIAHDPAYEQHSREFVETYLQFPPGIEHELVVGTVGGDANAWARSREIFGRLNCLFKSEPPEGWDITHHQSIAKTLDCDFAVFCTSRTYFWRAGWLKRLVEARLQLGEGLYGSVGSYEVNPHIRTVLFGCNPQALRDFPHLVDTRQKAGWFEAGKWNFTGRFNGRAYMVTWNNVYLQPDWRTPPNIFRRGDQSNMLAWDKHSKIYAEASPAQKKELEKQADGLYRGYSGKFRHFCDRYLFHKFR
jgi:hypothetical protein